MSNNNNNSGRGGIGFVGLLQIAFIVLRLCGVIKWSWLWVLSPAWIWVLLFMILVVIQMFF